jgi:hypothetical protein
MTAAEIAEKYAAEDQKSEGLPEGDRTPSSQGRDQPVPEMHDHFAANGDESYQRERTHNKDPFVSHDPVLFHGAFLISS